MKPAAREPQPRLPLPTFQVDEGGHDNWKGAGRLFIDIGPNAIRGLLVGVLRQMFARLEENLATD